MSELRLRNVEQTDVDLIYRWANDEECRKNAFHPEKIAYETHVQWFQQKLQSDNCDMFILMKEQEAIGLVRVDYEETKGVISYSIDAAHRGHGYGYAMLQLLEKNMDRTDQLVGEVKKNNPASQKVFEKLGYCKKETEKCYVYTKYIEVQK